MCVQARFTSPMEAHEHAGTLCPTSLAQTVAEVLPGEGNKLLFYCLVKDRSVSVTLSVYYNRDQKYQKRDFASVAGYFLNPFLCSNLLCFLLMRHS